MTASVVAARAIKDERVELERVDGIATGNAVISSPNEALGYQVVGALTARPQCSCPAGLQGGFCKHLVKVLLLLGKTENQVIRAWGSLRGSQAGVKMIAKWAAAPPADGAAVATAAAATAPPAAGASQLACAGSASNAIVQQSGGNQHEPAAACSGTVAVVQRVNYRQQFESQYAAVLALLEGQPDQGSHWEAASNAEARMLSDVRVLTASTNRALLAPAAAALAANPLAPDNMSRARLKGPTERWGRSYRGGTKAASQRTSAATALAARAGPPEVGAAASAFKRSPLKALRVPAPKRPRNIGGQADKVLGPMLAPSDSQPLQLEAPPSHHELLAQSVQHAVPGGFMALLNEQ